MIEFQQKIESAALFTLFRFLPISILVLNSELELMYINHIAQSFFRVDNVDEYCGREQVFVADHECLRGVIADIKSGGVVSNKKVLVTKLDKSVTMVELFAHSFSEVGNAYVFMFSELKA